MNHNEKLGLIERVNHASEDQAKRTLRSMILKCTVTQPTIARAIKDAIERHTPTPMIVYQQPESGDDDGVVLASSVQKSNGEKKDQDGGSQDGGDAPPTTSKRHRSTRRGDINPDPLVGQIILKKTKSKLRGKKKRGSDHDEEQSSPDLSKKKSKNASKLRAETEQRACGNSMGRSSEQNKPTVIDLVTSSDNETSDTEQSENESLDDKSSDNGSPDKDSPDDYSSNDDSSDDDRSDDDSSGDEVSQNEQQDGVLPGGTQPFQDVSNNKANQASAKSGDGSRGAAHSITISMAKASSQKNGSEMSPFGSGRKRNAPERTVEEVHNDQSAKSATNSHINKRSKQNHLHEPHRSPEDRQCENCELILPSVAQLLKHRLHCEGATATLDNHHRSEPPWGERPREIKQHQKASNPADDSFTDEPRYTLQLPSRPRQRTPSDRGLSVPPPSFVREPNNFPRGPTPTPLALARSDSGIQSSPPGLIHHPAPKPPSDVPSDQQLKRPEPKSLGKRLLEPFRGKTLHRCKVCRQRYRSCENSKNACISHSGQYRLLKGAQLNPDFFKDGIVPAQPFIAWTCCRRQGKDAPPCRTGRHIRRQSKNRRTHNRG